MTGPQIDLEKENNRVRGHLRAILAILELEGIDFECVCEVSSNGDWRICFHHDLYWNTIKALNKKHKQTRQAYAEENVIRLGYEEPIDDQ